MNELKGFHYKNSIIMGSNELTRNIDALRKTIAIGNIYRRLDDNPTIDLKKELEIELKKLNGVPISNEKTEYQKFQAIHIREYYKKPWKKSPAQMKRVKLLRFAGKNKVLANFLLDAFENKEIRVDSVECDEETFDIVSITGLNDLGGGKYEIISEKKVK